MSRSWVILADGYLTARNAKTAHGVIRYSRDDIAAVLDRDNAGRRVSDLLPELGRDAPIVGTLAEALALSPTAFLLGVATPGGWMPDHWREWILEAIDAGLEVVNGLHSMLTDDPDLVARAEEKNVRLWDVRKPPDDIPLFSGRSLDVPQKIALTVGSDCAVGKKTTALELTSAGIESGRRCEFVATGQTGVLIAGKGIAVDRVSRISCRGRPRNWFLTPSRTPRSCWSRGRAACGIPRIRPSRWVFCTVPVPTPSCFAIKRAGMRSRSRPIRSSLRCPSS